MPGPDAAKQGFKRQVSSFGSDSRLRSLARVLQSKQLKIRV